MNEYYKDSISSNFNEMSLNKKNAYNQNVLNGKAKLLLFHQ